MKNKLIFILVLISFFKEYSFAETLQIKAKNISLDKINNTTIFKDDVIIITEDQNIISADYVEYDKKNGFLILKNNIEARDKLNNLIKTNFAEYNENDKRFVSKGQTIIITTDLYEIDTKDITLNNSDRIISSKENTIVKDQDGNSVYLENFKYSAQNNIFKSIGEIKIDDEKGNSYQFSQIYIDTKKKEILGTDIKAFLNQKELKFNENNKPRIFANTINLSKQKSLFKKSVFTICDYRKNDKCPPWTIQASEMLHDNNKKTIYYDNAVIKVYDIPIFYLPKLSHPDPTVDRRSGFLNPTLYDTKNLGLGVSVPYFFDIDKDKNFTLTSRLYQSENPLFLGEYHQAFKNSYFFSEFGYTAGYKQTSTAKRSGEKSHFFGKFVKNFFGKNGSENSFSFSYQDTSNDKYLKLYQIESNLVDYNTTSLESSFNFTHENDDIFVGVNASMYETLKDTYNDKYEYILPEITLDKNLLSNNFGDLNFQSNLQVHNYDTNKTSNFLTNNFNWVSRNSYFENGINTQILANLRNINYSAKNINKFKDETTNELFGAIGYLAELDLEKTENDDKHFLTPKMLVRYSPGQMRKEDSGGRIDATEAFSINRMDNSINNYETGLTASLGLDYKIRGDGKDFDFSMAQIISEKENKKMSSESSLDEKLSDMVGKAEFKLNESLSLTYDFALDQNYTDVNYSSIGTTMNFDNLKINFNYFKEQKHYGEKDYFNTDLSYNLNKNTLLSFQTKRDLVTNSSQFYNLSYEYINDCLRAGLVYRREFYTDPEVEAENSLMFTITLVPLGGTKLPEFKR